MTDHWEIIDGDAIAEMAKMKPASADAIVTDPPYGLEFMGKDWDAPWKASNGFRRSHNAADAGRENAFGRLSAHGPEYRAGEGFERWSESWAREALRVLKPGGHLAAFGGTRTYHRLVCGLEDAGFEIRDGLAAWLYGSGFPKSLDVSRAVDARKDWSALRRLQSLIKDARERLGASQSEIAQRIGIIPQGTALGGGGFMWFETGLKIPTPAQYAALKAALDLDGSCDGAFEAATREVSGWHRDSAPGQNMRAGIGGGAPLPPGEITEPLSDAGRAWRGWGTALKPAWEPIVLARKPLDGTVAANVLEHGTGALNVDGCRTVETWPTSRSYAPGQIRPGGKGQTQRTGAAPAGRWPANVVLACACESPLRVCLESPYAGDVDANVAYARAAMADSLRRGEQPIASHLLYTQPGILRDEAPEERALGIAAGLAWGSLADATVLYMDRGISRGMEHGLERAHAGGRAVIRRWLNGLQELEAHAIDCPVRMLDEQSGERGGGFGTSGGSPEGHGKYRRGFPRGDGRVVGFGDAGGASRFFYSAKASTAERQGAAASRSTHPTVKPLDLMRWLCRLVTPPGGLILDPFCGSGTTLHAALLEGFRCIGIEQDAEMVRFARERVAGPLFASAGPNP